MGNLPIPPKASERFEALARRIALVPKREVDAKRIVRSKARASRKPPSTPA